MEGSGIADAAWERRSGYMVIRGICDYGDANKADVWQQYAAAAAAAYARALIERLLGIMAPPEKFTALGRLPANGGSLIDAACLSILVHRDSRAPIVPRPTSHPFVDLARQLRQQDCELEIVVQAGKPALKANPRFSIDETFRDFLPLSEIGRGEIIYHPRLAPSLKLAWNEDARELTLHDASDHELIIRIEPPA